MESNKLQGEHPEKYKLISEAVSDLIRETFGNFTECEQQILVSYADLFALAEEAIKLSQIQSNTVEDSQPYCRNCHNTGYVTSGGSFGGAVYKELCCCQTSFPESNTVEREETNKGEDVEEAFNSRYAKIVKADMYARTQDEVRFDSWEDFEAGWNAHQQQSQARIKELEDVLKQCRGAFSHHTATIYEQQQMFKVVDKALSKK